MGIVVILIPREQNVQEDLQLWIDIICIDQNSRYLPQELEKLPLIYSSCNYHYVIGNVTFTRGWCQFELAISSWYRWAKALDTHKKDEADLDNDTFVDSHAAINHGLIFLLGQEELAKFKEAVKDDKSLEDMVQFEKAQFTVQSDASFVKESVLKIFPSIEALNTHLVVNIAKHMKTVRQ